MSARPIAILSNADVESVADWAPVIDALRRAYGQPIAETMVPPRTVAAGRKVSMRSLTAVSPGGAHVGAKLLTVAAANAPDVAVSYLVALIDLQTAEVVALMDGNHITGLRTAATSALAVDHIAPARPLRVAVLGSGFEAWNHLAAIASVRPLIGAAVFSPTVAKREAFAERGAVELGLSVQPADGAEAAVDGADLVVCAARSYGEVPIFEGRWLRSGMSVVSIGSTTPAQREVDAEAIGRADRIVVDVFDEVVHHSGDCLAATDAGVAFAERVVTLADVVAGQVPGRSADGDIVMYKSVGSALQDVVVAELMLDRAVAAGRGSSIPAFVVPVRK